MVRSSTVRTGTARRGCALTVVNVYRHAQIIPQEDFPNGFPPELAEDRSDPATFREFCGFGSLLNTPDVVPLPEPQRS